MNPQSERLTGDGFIPPWVRREHQARYDFAARYVRGKAVVDCACGEGLSSEIFLRAGARSLTGFDLSEEAVAAARKRCAGNATFSTTGGVTLPIADRSADLYVALETLEHIEEDRAFLREAARVLKPDGVFICSTPNRLVTNPGASISDRPWNRFHVREYDPSEFVDRLGGAFQRIEMFGQNPRPQWSARAMESAGRLLSPQVAVTLGQLLKIHRLVLDRPGYHTVRTTMASLEYEYLVAVCQEPKP